ncbi:DoxX family protein [Bradyrhizobium sp.]|jgi:putative oxidoreductase|uniref:DoxX family protein n=1 Tax=Bradyrhizobium sp. TaxID=376 RepID=UPI003C1A5926
MTSLDSRPATNATQDKVLLAARLLVAPLFFYSGIGKILAFGVTASRLPGGEGGFGSFLAAGSIVIELGASLALVLGIYTRCAAIVLIVFTILATLMFHNFWASPPAQVTAQTVQFLKNLDLIGLFAMIAAFGPGSYSLRKK